MEDRELSLSTKIGGRTRPSFANSVARILIAAVEKQTGRGARMDGWRGQAIAQKMF